MSRIVFLLEEYSMKVLLDGLLPRLFPGLGFLCVPHEGKQDLEKSIPKKLRGWREPGVCFVIIRDQDAEDCIEIKRRLVDLCAMHSERQTLVRICCQELEAWYLGEPPAMARAFGKENLATISAKARFRNPDAVTRPSDEIVKLVPEFQKVSGARIMAKWLTRDGNSSQSFKTLVEGIAKLSVHMDSAKPQKG